MVSVECKKCGGRATKTPGRYNESLKNGWNFFCSLHCRYGYRERGKEVPCARCGRLIRKTPAQIRQTKTNIFCSKSCAAIYNNSHKQTGTRRLKLEAFVEQQLREQFPHVTIQCNDHHLIGAELDFYFPELRLAIELNGIVHYQPIYGQKKLERIQELDRQKVTLCLGADIELRVVDVSEKVYLSQTVKKKYWRAVKELVTSVQRRAGHTSVQVSLS
jgi:very-short-patch-repair endonuclease